MERLSEYTTDKTELSKDERAERNRQTRIAAQECAKLFEILPREDEGLYPIDDELQEARDSTPWSIYSEHDIDVRVSRRRLTERSMLDVILRRPRTYSNATYKIYIRPTNDTCRLGDYYAGFAAKEQNSTIYYNSKPDEFLSESEQLEQDIELTTMLKDMTTTLSKLAD